MWNPEIAAGVVTLALLAVAVCAPRVRRGRYDARITVRGGGAVRVEGRLSPAALSALRAFFQTDFARRGPLTVLIRRRPAGRTFELRFRPEVSPGERQQVRNFLAAHVPR